MHWRSGTEASTQCPGPPALAGPVCVLLLLLAGTPAPAQTAVWPPAWVPPGASNFDFQTSWRQVPAEPAAAMGPARAVLAGLEPDPTAPVLRCAAPDGPAAIDDTPVFPIQLRLRRPALGQEMDEEEGTPQFLIQLQPPGPERVFRLESEVAFLERIRQSTPRTPFEPVIFPREPILSQSKEPPRRVWPWRSEFVEPSYVCYSPLLFQQKYLERYGWDLGAVTPFVSLGAFWFDSLVWPYRLAIGPWCGQDCNSGYCLPGDPTPLRLDPPEWPLSFEVNISPGGPHPDGCGCATH
jgi:hypothetical protein